MDKFISRSLFTVVFVLCFFNSWTTAMAISSDYEDEIKPSWGRCPWIRDKLKNGRVKMRSRGRIAKFACNVGYELVGKRFSTCVRGQWNNDVPICVSAGCYRLPKPENSKVTDMYRGALLIYDCLPGYVRHGPSSLYCDGSKWSEAAPICEVATQEPTFSCDFEESDLCGWTQDPSHDVDWRRNQFITPSGHFGTGPSGDHTFGQGKAGFYMYLEASTPQKENDSARLFSPVYPSSSSPGCFVFWYHMYGNGTGGLKVYIKQESHVFGNIPESWEKFGDQGNQWLQGVFTVPEISENFQIVVEGVRGPNYESDIAIDDVNLVEDSCNKVLDQSASPAEASSDSCRGRCSEDVQETTDCSCSSNCAILNVSTCCSDYTAVCNTVTVPAEPDEWQETILDYSTTTTTVSKTSVASLNESSVAPTSTTYPTSHTSIDSSSTLIKEATEKEITVPSTTTTPQWGNFTATNAHSAADITIGEPFTQTRMKTEPQSTSSSPPSSPQNSETRSFALTSSDNYTITTTLNPSSADEKRSGLTLTISSDPSEESNETTTVTSFEHLDSSPWTTTQDSSSTSGLYDDSETRLAAPTTIAGTPAVVFTMNSSTTQNSGVILASSSSSKESSATVNSPSTGITTTSFRLGSSSTRELTYRLPVDASPPEATTVKQEPTDDLESERAVSQKELHEVGYRNSDSSRKSDSSEIDAGNGSVTAAVVTMCLMLGAATATAVFFFKRRKRKQNKLAEDSEIKYLSDNEIVEFYESSPKKHSRR